MVNQATAVRAAREFNQRTSCHNRAKKAIVFNHDSFGTAVVVRSESGAFTTALGDLLSELDGCVDTDPHVDADLLVF